ncbi:MAG TPA: hypothetical protein VE864_13610 [Streptosporangiaceae bacterium]|nr:hypothetical protein [Streptosporangiaceae bacterium]
MRSQQRDHPPGGLAQMRVGQHEIIKAERLTIRMVGRRPVEQGRKGRHGVLHSAPLRSGGCLSGHDLVLPGNAGPLIRPGDREPDPYRDPWPGAPRAASAGCALSHLGCRAQTSGCAQGTAEALPGLLTMLGCSEFGVKPPCQALAPGLRQHFALPLTDEFPGDVGVHEHGLLLST